MEFTNYENVGNVNNAHSKLTQRSIEVIEEETCVKDKRIKQSSQEQLYSEILEEFLISDKLFKKKKKEKENSAIIFIIF